MELYVSPFACSFAARVAIYEAGLENEIRLRAVDLKTHMLDNGQSYLAVHSVGQVPALLTREGRVLTENLAILLYIADMTKTASLGPRDGYARYELLQWLSFISCVFKALVSSTPNRTAQEAAMARPSVARAIADEMKLLGAASGANGTV